MFSWFFNLFRRRPLAERQEADKRSAVNRAERKVKRYWTIAKLLPITWEWVEGDRMIGGIPVKYDDRFARPVGGLYHIGKLHIEIITYQGRWSVRVMVHEVCHAILDKMLIGHRITWHHKLLSSRVFGWPAEAGPSGRAERAVRKLLRCPRVVSECARGVMADCIEE